MTELASAMSMRGCLLARSGDRTPEWPCPDGSRRDGGGGVVSQHPRLSLSGLAA